jgi:hypothetical protein
MKEVRVHTEELKAKVQLNRDAHRDVYLTAMDGYRKVVIDWFNEQLDKAQNGMPFVTYLHEPMPEDHTDDYDVVLSMLAMSIDETITLTLSEYRQYVMDDWGWKESFSTTTSKYTA